MLAKVDITKAKVDYLNLISDAEAKKVLGKGWTLPFVYTFQEIRDVYWAFCKYGQAGMTVAEFSNKYVRDRIPYVRSRWDEKGRRVLEIKNALINFGIINQKTLACKSNVFEKVESGSPLSEDDMFVFREIFFKYFRFQEFSSLLIRPDMSTEEKVALREEDMLERSQPLYYYGSVGTRVDTFFYTLKSPETLYKFPLNSKGNVKGGFVRFWDVFLSWATQLKLIERLNMKRQGFLLSNNKTFSAVYFVDPSAKVDVAEMLDKKFHRQLLIDISDLMMGLCLHYRCSINDAQQAIIDYYQRHADMVSLIRTSEIFIKKTELNKNDRILYPKYKGSFVSHIKLRSYE